ncbi:RNA polymerase sigma factor [Intestinimonas sp. HCP28S3_D6]|uniref:RNA polymerase sigma factor n=1 Tax=Intestinimonas sp. HCP28S3_D6 TaxID=3438942 RepID=UPI003F8A9D73
MREAAMLRKIRAGDPAGLEGLMTAYLPYVSVIVWNILRGAMPPEDGEEVVSDVFLAAWDQAADLRAGHVKGWLGAVARNKARNKLRQAGKTLPLEENILELPDPSDPTEGLTREEERVQVRQAVEALLETDREIFLRHYYYAQTVREIAEAMELKEPTVKTKLRRGREKLKAMLTKGDETGET